MGQRLSLIMIDTDATARSSRTDPHTIRPNLTIPDGQEPSKLRLVSASMMIGATYGTNVNSESKIFDFEGNGELKQMLSLKNRLKN